MADITVYGFPHSSFVHIVQLVLNHKEVPHTFHVNAGEKLHRRPE